MNMVWRYRVLLNPEVDDLPIIGPESGTMESTDV